MGSIWVTLVSLSGPGRESCVGADHVSRASVRGLAVRVLVAIGAESDAGICSWIGDLSEEEGCNLPDKVCGICRLWEEEDLNSPALSIDPDNVVAVMIGTGAAPPLRSDRSGVERARDTNDVGAGVAGEPPIVGEAMIVAGVGLDCLETLLVAIVCGSDVWLDVPVSIRTSCGAASFTGSGTVSEASAPCERLCATALRKSARSCRKRLLSMVIM